MSDPVTGAGRPRNGEPRRLARRREAFAVHYAETLNATRSAIFAGYSPKSAAVQGALMLADERVTAIIDRRRREMARTAGASAQRIVDALCEIAFADLREAFHPDGRLRLPSEIPDHLAGAVSEYTGGGVKSPPKVKLADKLTALKMLGDHLGMFRQRVELSGPDGGPVDVRNLSDQQLVALIAAQVELSVVQQPDPG